MRLPARPTRALPACLILAAAPAIAHPPEIVAVERTGERIEVTLAHADTGWDHYADGWRVEGPDGAILGLRELLHPHVEEQPFTRALSVDLPGGLDRVQIRARCSVSGWADEVVALPLD